MAELNEVSYVTHVYFCLFTTCHILSRCEHGIIKNWFPSSELKPYEGIPHFKCIQDPNIKTNTITLREASKSRKDKVKCGCSKTCSNRRCPCKAVGISCSSHCHPKNKLCNNHEVVNYEEAATKLDVKEEKDCFITDMDGQMYSPAVLNRKGVQSFNHDKQPSKRKVSHQNIPKLSADMTAIIRNGDWLVDQHITIASKMLKAQFPLMSGLYNPVLGQTLSFPVTQEAFVQMLHVGGNHWITIENVPSLFVNVYDSVYGTVSVDTKKQIASLLCTKSSTIVLKIHKTQLQVGTSDCGLFAIAYATELAFGHNPASSAYCQEQMRRHFEQCIANKQLIPFPSKTVKSGRPRTEQLKIYCICRMPDDKKEKMAQCCKCKEWYHKSCEKIPVAVFNNRGVTWNCRSCSRSS